MKFKSRSLKDLEEGSISNEIYKLIRNHVNRIVKNAKNEYYERSFHSFKTQPRKAWNLLQSLMGKENARTNIDSIIVNNVEYTDGADMADKFIDYFSQFCLHGCVSVYKFQWR